MPTHWSEALSQGSAVTTPKSEDRGWAPLRRVGLGTQPMVPPPALVPLSPESHVLRPEPGSLSEKVSHLESMLRKLQDDLQKVTRWLRVVGSHRAAPGEGPGAGHADSCLAPPPPRRRQTGRPWRRRCGACGTTTGGCRPSRRARPPACSWPPSSWAPPPATWPEAVGSSLSPAADLLELPGLSLGAPGPHRAPGPPQGLSLREAHLSTAPAPRPIIWWHFGGEVALLPHPRL